MAAGVDGDPAGMVAWCRCINAVDQCEETSFRVLFVSPDFVCTHICRVQVCFCGVEHHAVNTRVRVYFEVLHVFVYFAGLGDGEDVAEARVFVEWVTVDVVGWFVASEDEDGACVCVGGVGHCYIS